MTRKVELHVGDIGTEVIISLVDGDDPVNLTALSSAVIKVQRPNKTTKEISATVLGEVEEGKLIGIAPEGTFTIDGYYHIQAFLTIGTWKGHSEAKQVIVYPAVS